MNLSRDFFDYVVLDGLVNKLAKPESEDVSDVMDRLWAKLTDKERAILDARNIT